MITIIKHKQQSKIDKSNNKSKKTLTPTSRFPSEGTFSTHDTSNMEASTPTYHFLSEGAWNSTAESSVDASKYTAASRVNALTRDEFHPSTAQRSTRPKGAPNTLLSTSKMLPSIALRD